MKQHLRIGIDLDDTVNMWFDPYIAKFGIPKDDYTITKHVQNVLIKDKDFWLNLPIKHKPDFDVELICTKRVNPKSWTKQYLKEKLNITAPVYQCYIQKGSKSKMIKGKVDVFIDDSISNYNEMNDNGVPCLLMDSPYNRHFETSYRVYSLNYVEIEKVYNKYVKDNRRN